MRWLWDAAVLSHLEPFDINYIQLAEVFASSVDRRLTDLILLGSLFDRRPIRLARDRDHLFFRESTLFHRLLEILERSF
jgi:hypothetical protein